MDHPVFAFASSCNIGLALAEERLLAGSPATGHTSSGVAAAFALHVAFAVAAGSLLVLLPHRLLEIVVAAAFAFGAVLLLRGRRGHGEQSIDVTGHRPGFWCVAATSFAVILVAEFGDLTQILTAGLAARYHNPVAVGLGSVLALWAVAAIAITGGRGLLQVIPLTWITRAAALAMVVLAGISLAAAIR